MLWLAPVLLDAPALHACPMHDALPPSAHPAAIAAMAGMAGMPAGDGVAGGATRHAHDAHVHGCTCLGACALAGAVLPPTSVAVALALAATPAHAPTGSPSFLARGAASHFLPFAHAPPLSA